jgi:hypothetical protein
MFAHRNPTKTQNQKLLVKFKKKKQNLKNVIESVLCWPFIAVHGDFS